MMLLSWLSEDTVRYKVLRLRIELICRNLFQGVFLLVVHAHTLVDQGKLACTYFLSNLVATSY